MTVNVWTYWEGAKPAYIDVCLRSMARACDVPGVEFRLMTPENASDYVRPGAIHENWKELKLRNPSHKAALTADVLRPALLAAHGGWWWDADTVCLRSPKSLTEKHRGVSALYMTWDKQPLRILNGYIYVSPETAAEWLDRVNAKLADELDSIIWGTLGEGILTSLLIANNGAVQIPRRLFLPVDIDSQVEKFFQPGDPFELVDEDTICCGLNHSYFWHHHRREMEADWGQGDLLIHRLLDYARRALAC